MDFVVGAYLYHHYPEMHEGELTSLRAALVRARTLAEFARELNLGHYLRLGYGEAENGWGANAHLFYVLLLKLLLARCILTKDYLLCKHLLKSL